MVVLWLVTCNWEMVTVVSHDVFEGRQVAHWRLIAAEDLGARAKVIWEFLAVLLPHLLVSAQVVDLTVERHVVGRPVTCGTHRFSTTCSNWFHHKIKTKKWKLSLCQSDLCVVFAFGLNTPPVLGSARPQSAPRHPDCCPDALYSHPQPCTDYYTSLMERFSTGSEHWFTPVWQSKLNPDQTLTKAKN